MKKLKSELEDLRISILKTEAVLYIFGVFILPLLFSMLTNETELSLRTTVTFASTMLVVSLLWWSRIRKERYRLNLERFIKEHGSTYSDYGG